MIDLLKDGDKRVIESLKAREIADKIREKGYISFKHKHRIKYISSSFYCVKENDDTRYKTNKEKLVDLLRVRECLRRDWFETSEDYIRYEGEEAEKLERLINKLNKGIGKINT